MFRGFYTKGLFLLCIGIGLFNSSTSYSVNDAKNLHEKLFNQSEYKKLFRPNNLVTVKAGYSLQYLNSLNIKTQVMSTTGLFTVNIKTQVMSTTGLFTVIWKDSRLIWEQSSYGGIDNIYVPENIVWHPALVVLNSIHELEKNFGAGSTIRISSDGTLRWESIAVLSTSCAMNVVFFPFDSQKCTIELVSWYIPSHEVTLKFLDFSINLNLHRKQGDWEILYTTNRSSWIAEDEIDYSLLEFEMVLKRLSGHYIMIVIFPTILTAALTFVAFFLPIKQGIRIQYILTVVLALVVLLTLFADTMPSTTVYPSMLVALFTVTLGMAFLLVIITIFVMGLHSNPKRHTAPNWMHFIVRKTRTLKLRLNRKATRINPSEQQQPRKDDRSTKQTEKERKSTQLKPYSNKELAEFFDYFLFVVFTVLYLLSVPITVMYCYRVARDNSLVFY